MLLIERILESFQIPIAMRMSVVFLTVSGVLPINHGWPSSIIAGSKRTR
jgi:hypothetical protein